MKNLLNINKIICDNRWTIHGWFYWSMFIDVTYNENILLIIRKNLKRWRNQLCLQHEFDHRRRVDTSIPLNTK